jgi:hypothetical protein
MGCSFHASSTLEHISSAIRNKTGRHFCLRSRVGARFDLFIRAGAFVDLEITVFNGTHSILNRSLSDMKSKGKEAYLQFKVQQLYLNILLGSIEYVLIRSLIRPLSLENSVPGDGRMSRVLRLNGYILESHYNLLINIGRWITTIVEIEGLQSRQPNLS